tara:strand:+ start:439 stop:1884 length:1446 start_codon:yes stop_codon:yes gene_type:complete
MSESIQNTKLSTKATIDTKDSVENEESTEAEIPVKKKRGRKPKDKSKEPVESVEPKIPKKRGRKPKVKTEEELKPKIPGKRGRKPKDKSNIEPKVPKKRGRKPKETTIGIINNNVNDKESENIIIHLPIQSKNIKTNMNDDLLTYNPTLTEPTPYEDNITGSKIDNYQFISQSGNNTGDSQLTGVGSKPISEFCQYPFDEKQQEIFDVLEDLDDSESIQSVDNKNKLDEEYNVNHNKDWYSKESSSAESKEDVIQIMDHIKKQRDFEKDNYTSKTSKTTVEKCIIQFDEANKTNKWPSSTSIHCWWCCHPFSGPPCALPCDYKNDTFKVFGIFCSPECAASYNFDDVQSGCDIWERYSLLNFLYRKIYNDNNIKIKLAPPKQTLKIFGGHLSIKEFRMNNTNYSNTYKMIIPPLISIIPIQELTSIDNGYSSTNDKKYIIIEKDNINDNSSLRLKRTKPFNSNKNTLDKCMLVANTNQSIE